MNRILFLFLISFTSVINYPRTCNAGNVKHGNCVSSTYAMCQKKYATKEDEDDKWCNYKQRNQLTYFLIEAIAAFGAGHFYAKNYKYAVPKLIYWILTWSFIISVRCFSLKRGLNDQHNLVCSLAALLFTIGMIIWYVYDIVLIGENRYLDGDGVELNPW